MVSITEATVARKVYVLRLPPSAVAAVAFIFTENGRSTTYCRPNNHGLGSFQHGLGNGVATSGRQKRPKNSMFIINRV
eukprot:scaffold98367_cov42-Prasinocladus_malaysianus.AAC.2